jgi:hypothetical protein
MKLHTKRPRKELFLFKNKSPKRGEPMHAPGKIDNKAKNADYK